MSGLSWKINREVERCLRIRASHTTVSILSTRMQPANRSDADVTVIGDASAIALKVILQPSCRGHAHNIVTQMPSDVFWRDASTFRPRIRSMQVSDAEVSPFPASKEVMVHQLDDQAPAFLDGHLIHPAIQRLELLKIWHLRVFVDLVAAPLLGTPHRHGPLSVLIHQVNSYFCDIGKRYMDEDVCPSYQCRISYVTHWCNSGHRLPCPWRAIGYRKATSIQDLVLTLWNAYKLLDDSQSIGLIIQKPDDVNLFAQETVDSLAFILACCEGHNGTIFYYGRCACDCKLSAVTDDLYRLVAQHKSNVRRLHYEITGRKMSHLPSIRMRVANIVKIPSRLRRIVPGWLERTHNRHPRQAKNLDIVGDVQCEIPGMPFIQPLTLRQCICECNSALLPYWRLSCTCLRILGPDYLEVTDVLCPRNLYRGSASL
jgi:hypothetical protein